jgi:hypothetical protein
MHSIDKQIEEGEALVAGHPHGSPEFARGLDFLQRSAESGRGTAQLILGHVYSQFHVLPDAPRQAAHWYRRAAESGEARAYDRLADLYMIGRGVAADDAEAFRLYGLTAARGYAVSQCNLAYMLAEGIGCPVDTRMAAGWYLRAAAQGELRAYFNLAVAFRDGLGVPQDRIHAGAWMESARRQQYPCSQGQLARICEGLGGSDLDAIRRLADRIDGNFMGLQRALESDPAVLASAERYRTLVERNFGTLGMPAFSLDDGLRPPGGEGARFAPAKPEQVSAAPRIFTVDEFISAGECAHLMIQADRNFVPAHRLTADILSQENLAFTGNMAALQTVLCDALVRNVERRVGKVFDLPSSHVEPLSVLRYRHENSYAAHVDYFDAKRMEENRRKGDLAGQRIASFLVYLRAPEAGGETRYLKPGIRIRGRERMALCHFNCLSSGEPDPATLHTGEPVQRGEKWLARTTVRERPFY